MLEKTWEKLDKFVLILAVVLTLMAVVVIVAFRGIFSAYLDANEINNKDTKVDTEIEKEQLEEAYLWATNKTSVSLQIRD